MLIEMCTGKIHRATVTEADLNYKGSITIDVALVEAAGMRRHQYVNITNYRNGIFWRTYIMLGKRDSGVICLNGPPARLFQKGDQVVILAVGWMTPEEADKNRLTVVFVDEENRITSVERQDSGEIG